MWRFLLVLIAAVAIFAPTPSGGGTTAAPEPAFARGGGSGTMRADGARARVLLRDAFAPAWSPAASRPSVSNRPGGEAIERRP